MSNTHRPALTNVSMSSFSQSGTATSQINEMFGEKAKNITVQGPYSANQSSAATSDVVEVWADYGVYDYSASQNLDVNSTNFKDNA